MVTTASYSSRAEKADMAHYTAMKTALSGVTMNIARTYGHLTGATVIIDGGTDFCPSGPRARAQ